MHRLQKYSAPPCFVGGSLLAWPESAASLIGLRNNEWPSSSTVSEAFILPSLF